MVYNTLLINACFNTLLQSLAYWAERLYSTILSLPSIQVYVDFSGADTTLIKLLKGYENAYNSFLNRDFNSSILVVCQSLEIFLNEDKRLTKFKTEKRPWLNLNKTNLRNADLSGVPVFALMVNEDKMTRKDDTPLLISKIRNKVAHGDTEGLYEIINDYLNNEHSQNIYYDLERVGRLCQRLKDIDTENVEKRAKDPNFEIEYSVELHATLFLKNYFKGYLVDRAETMRKNLLELNSIGYTDMIAAHLLLQQILFFINILMYEDPQRRTLINKRSRQTLYDIGVIRLREKVENEFYEQSLTGFRWLHSILPR